VTGNARPWWASDADAADTDPLDPLDPLEAHRAARRGQVPLEGPASWWDTHAPSDDAPVGDAPVGDAPVGEEPGGEEPGGPDREAQADEPGAAGPGHGPDVCGVCPLCTALRMLGETRPQLVEHLTEAARHLAAAVRSVVDEPPRARGDAAKRGRDTDAFERIDLD
jgi:hypothetical protein